MAVPNPLRIHGSRVQLDSADKVQCNLIRARISEILNTEFLNSISDNINVTAHLNLLPDGKKAVAFRGVESELSQELVEQYEVLFGKLLAVTSSFSPTLLSGK